MDKKLDSEKLKKDFGEELKKVAGYPEVNFDEFEHIEEETNKILEEDRP